MLVLIFDTETSGLDPQWNVILQLSYQIVDSNNWQTIKTVNHYFPWPTEKSRVTTQAIEVNGLTEERLANECLSNRKEAFEEFVADKDKCGLLVAHNLDFDKKFILSGCAEEGVKYAASGWMNTYDTMKKTVRYCAIPKSWGNGYKWPKLTELADCLWVKYSDINLHDSAGDVELTKRCFESLVANGEYHFPQGEEISVKITVESPSDIRYTAYNDKGEEISELMLDMMVSKSRWKAACQELLRMWSEENEAEHNEYLKIHAKSPAIKSSNDYYTELQELKPNKYQRKTFVEEEPSRQQLEEKLQEEAKSTISSILFWTNKKKRQQYVDERLEVQYQQLVREYNSRKEEFDALEDEAEKVFNTNSISECEAQKLFVQKLIDGDVDCLEMAIEKSSILNDYPLPYKINCVVNNGTMLRADVRLPRIEDLPKLQGVRLASGNYKIKEMSDKDLRADYAECITGLAFYVASTLLNISPVLESIRIDAHTLRCDKEGTEQDEYLYSVVFDRASLSQIIFSDCNPVEELQSFKHIISITKTNLIKAIDINKL